MDSFSVELVIQQLAWLLLGAALVGMLARRIRVPYAVALVLGGLLVEESHLVAVPRLEPGLVLFVFLPPLLFDAAFRLDMEEFWQRLRPIVLLAAPGTLLTALVVGAIVTLALQLPISLALLFGSVVAATDPVAVTAVFKQLRASSELTVVMEGESLINDGMAITLYTAFIGLALSETAGVGGVLGLFAAEVLGGVLIGALLGVGFSRLTGAIDDHLLEMTLSTALAYGSYLVAQSAHTSGALACVAAGLIHGSYGRHVGMSENTRRLLDDQWEYLGFLANALLFLLVGFSVNVAALLTHLWPVTVAVAAVLFARVLVVGGAAGLLPREAGLRTLPERAVLIWGGLRGALTLALALALPPELPARDMLIAMAFGVVLFTLVVQGLTLPLLVRRTGLGC
jgi:CPA1 family monovalent cation:H+ antiporter